MNTLRTVFFYLTLNGMMIFICFKREFVCRLRSLVFAIINTKAYLSQSHSVVRPRDRVKAELERSIVCLFVLFFLSLYLCLFQSYIHGSSQAQFVAESHIILLLSILCHKTSLCTMNLSHCSVNEVNLNNPLTFFLNADQFSIL